MAATRGADAHGTGGRDEPIRRATDTRRTGVNDIGPVRRGGPAARAFSARARRATRSTRSGVARPSRSRGVARVSCSRDTARGGSRARGCG